MEASDASGGLRDGAPSATSARPRTSVLGKASDMLVNAERRQSRGAEDGPAPRSQRTRRPSVRLQGPPFPSQAPFLFFSHYSLSLFPLFSFSLSLWPSHHCSNGFFLSSFPPFFFLSFLFLISFPSLTLLSLFPSALSLSCHSCSDSPFVDRLLDHCSRWSPYSGVSRRWRWARRGSQVTKENGPFLSSFFLSSFSFSLFLSSLFIYLSLHLFLLSLHFSLSLSLTLSFCHFLSVSLSISQLVLRSEDVMEIEGDHLLQADNEKGEGPHAYRYVLPASICCPLVILDFHTLFSRSFSFRNIGADEEESDIDEKELAAIIAASEEEFRVDDQPPPSLPDDGVERLVDESLLRLGDSNRNEPSIPLPDLASKSTPPPSLLFHSHEFLFPVSFSFVR